MLWKLFFLSLAWRVTWLHLCLSWRASRRSCFKYHHWSENIGLYRHYKFKTNNLETLNKPFRTNEVTVKLSSPQKEAREAKRSPPPPKKHNRQTKRSFFNANIFPPYSLVMSHVAVESAHGLEQQVSRASFIPSVCCKKGTTLEQTLACRLAKHR